MSFSCDISFILGRGGREGGEGEGGFGPPFKKVRPDIATKHETY